MKRAILLSGSLGMGHDVLAEACTGYLAEAGWSARTLDAMRLLGKPGGSAGEAVFRSMLAVPGLYDAFHFAALRTGARLAMLADAGARRQVVPRLRDCLDAHPADLAISVFATGASAMSRLPGYGPCVLLMSGAWGLGPVAEAAKALGDAGVHVLAVAGRNARLEARLRAVARRQPRVHAFGFSDRIPELMAAADLVVTSSGDTCTEARTIGRPLLLLDVVQGHGRDNLQHELELGDAGVTSPRPAEMARNALAALDQVKPPPPGPARHLTDWQRAFAAALEKIGLNGD